MSGVYIPNMDVPKTCGGCLRVGWNYVFECRIDDVEEDERLSSCPLISIPEHGRMIDADAFVRFIKSVIERHSYGELKLKRGLTVKDVLDAVIADLEGSGVDGFANAPTIIPADRVKEGKE